MDVNSIHAIIIASCYEEYYEFTIGIHRLLTSCLIDLNPMIHSGLIISP